MAIEIEHKFLVTDESWRSDARKVVPIAQGYINDRAAVDSGAQRASVRVRIAGDEAFLNLKSRDSGPSRQEFEYPIPLDDARALLALCVGGTIEKRRHYLNHAGHVWEIDEFLGDNAGLVVAEIELSAAGEDFEKPAWAGADVTGLPRYYNLALASRPYSQWSDTERTAADIM
jgi:adenylate cyclase